MRYVFTVRSPPLKKLLLWLPIILHSGSPHWKYSELVFEKKQLIQNLQRLLTE